MNRLILLSVITASAPALAKTETSPEFLFEYSHPVLCGVETITSPADTKPLLLLNETPKNTADTHAFKIIDNRKTTSQTTKIKYRIVPTPYHPQPQPLYDFFLKTSGNITSTTPTVSTAKAHASTFTEITSPVNYNTPYYLQMRIGNWNKSNLTGGTTTQAKIVFSVDC